MLLTSRVETGVGGYLAAVGSMREGGNQDETRRFPSDRRSPFFVSSSTFPGPEGICPGSKFCHIESIQSPISSEFEIPAQVD